MLKSCNNARGDISSIFPCHYSSRNSSNHIMVPLFSETSCHFQNHTTLNYENSSSSLLIAPLSLFWAAYTTSRRIVTANRRKHQQQSGQQSSRQIINQISNGGQMLKKRQLLSSSFDSNNAAFCQTNTPMIYCKQRNKILQTKKKKKTKKQQNNSMAFLDSTHALFYLQQRDYDLGERSHRACISRTMMHASLKEDSLENHFLGKSTNFFIHDRPWGYHWNYRGTRRRSKNNVRKSIVRLWNSNANNPDSNLDYSMYEPMPNGGVYIDMGNVALNNNSNKNINSSSSSKRQINEKVVLESNSNTENTANEESMRAHDDIEKWRSNHWIVLIDDEPAIRLAIGDYLHSMGYTVMTACDGPMAFLEMMLWSCSWSLLESLMGEDEEKVGGDATIFNNEKIQNNEGSSNRTNMMSRPPWIDPDNHLQWRLPNCIISDIRMPGGIDGVELLELMRLDTDSLALAAESVGALHTSSKSKKKSKKTEDTKRMTKKRKKKTNTNNDVDEYDDEDEEYNNDSYDNNDIVSTDTTGSGDYEQTILSPTDKAIQMLHKIQIIIELQHQHQQQQQQKYQKQQQTHQFYTDSLQQIPCILLTAKAMISDRIQGYKAGADGYLPKPFRPEELLGMVDNLMRRQDREQTSGKIFSMDGGNELSPSEAEEIAMRLGTIKELLKNQL